MAEIPDGQLEPVPSTNPDATTCVVCGRAVMVAHVDLDGRCCLCTPDVQPLTNGEEIPAGDVEDGWGEDEG